MMTSLRRTAVLGAIGLLSFALHGCSPAGTSGGSGLVDAADDVRKLDVQSSEFQEGGTLPKAYTCDGEGISPPLSWRGAPPETKSYLIAAVDPDAPGGTFKHWAAYNVSASRTNLPAGASSKASELGFEQAKNDFGDASYGAACPPPSHGAHEYHFQVAALDVEKLQFEGTPRHSKVVGKAREHVVASGTLSASYDRN